MHQCGVLSIVFHLQVLVLISQDLSF
jgi:hypothetical protein